MKVSIAQLRAIGLSDTEILNLIETSQADQREQWRIAKQKQRSYPKDIQDNKDIEDKVSPSLSPPSMVSPITPSLTTPPITPPSEDTAYAVSSPTPYFFETGPIRLSERDFRKWEASFTHLDLRAELIALTEWARGQPKWFFAVSGALAKRNREMGLRLKIEGAKSGVESDRERRKRESREALAELRAFSEGRTDGDPRGTLVQLLPRAGISGGPQDISSGSS